MNRKEALEVYKKETEQLCKKGIEQLEQQYLEEEKWLKDRLCITIEKLCERVKKPVKYIQISLLQAQMDLEIFQLMICAYSEDYFLDSFPISEVIDINRLFLPLKNIRKQLYEYAEEYQGKIQKFDADSLIRKIAIEFYKKRAEKLRKFFRDIDQWNCIQLLPKSERFIVKWGEHRELSDTLFLMDKTTKTQEQFIAINEKNTIEKWDTQYVYQCFDNVVFLDMTVEKKNLMFIGMRTCHLERCQWDRVFFYGGSFRETVCRQVIFIGCDFTGCDFRNAILEQVQFLYCNLSEADFTGAVIEDTEFPNSIMEGAYFSRENLSGHGLDANQLQQVKLEEKPYVFYDGRR